MRDCKWRDIATAPKDSTRILAFANGVFCIAHRWIVNDEDRGWFEQRYWAEEIHPTHWMPLPDPPVPPPVRT